MGCWSNNVMKLWAWMNFCEFVVISLMNMLDVE